MTDFPSPHYALPNLFIYLFSNLQGQGDDSEKEKRENSIPKKENQAEVGAVVEKEEEEKKVAVDDVEGEVEKEIEEGNEGKEKEEVEVEGKEKTSKSGIKGTRSFLLYGVYCFVLIELIFNLFFCSLFVSSIFHYSLIISM